MCVCVCVCVSVCVCAQLLPTQECMSGKGKVVVQKIKCTYLAAKVKVRVLIYCIVLNFRKSNFFANGNF